MANAEATTGPACLALRRALRRDRPKLPPLLRASLAGSGVAAACMALLVGAGFLASTTTGIRLLQMVALTTVSGPQAASLFVFAQDPPLGLGWALAMLLLNMVATLLLVVPLAWRGFERLRDAPLLGGLARSAERFSVRHRRFLARWGLLGLVLVTFAPVQGAGVLGAGILGVILRMPLKRLLASVLAAGAALTVAWTLALYFGAQALPSGGVFDLVPYAVVAAFLVAGLVAAWQGHRKRFAFEVETIPGTPEAQRNRLLEVGIDEQDHVLQADLRQVAAGLGIDAKDLRRARNTAELLRLDNLPPQAAADLTRAGLVSIRELAAADPALVRAALVELQGRGAPQRKEVEAWQAEARRFEAAFHRQVDEHGRHPVKPRKRGRAPARPR